VRATIFDFPNQPAFYFSATGRIHTRFYQVPIFRRRRFSE
jgi:hypothetical protein